MKKRFVYLVYMPNAEGTSCDILEVVSSRNKAIQRVNYYNQDGDVDYVDYYREEVL